MSTKQMLFSGFGGQGLLFAGKFIAYKGLMDLSSGILESSAFMRVVLPEEVLPATTTETP